MTSVVLPAFDDPRSDGSMLGDERTVLSHWLDLYRETTLLKVAGLTAEQLATRSVPPSNMSPIGLVRHLTEVELYWLGEVVLGKEDIPDMYSTPDSPDGDFDNVTAQDAAANVAAYQETNAWARGVLTKLSDLDSPVAGLRRGKPVNLRWVLTHLIEEYARHLGHMDLLREAIDGQVGY